MDTMTDVDDGAAAKRTAAVVLAVVGLVMALAGTASLVGLAVANRDTEIRTFSGVRVLDIEGGAGDVKVEATGDEVGGQVSVQVRRRWSWRKPAVNGRLEGGTLRLGSGCQDAFLGVCEVTFLVKVPAMVPLTVHSGSGNVTADGMLAGVDLRTGSGDVRGSSLEGGVTAMSSSGNVTVGDVTGDVDVTSSSGDVVATAVSGTHVRMRTTSGNVRVEVEGQAPDEVVAETGSGNVELTLPDAAYRVQTRTGSGNVDTSGIAQDPASTHHVSATTGSGNVDIRRG